MQTGAVPALSPSEALARADVIVYDKPRNEFASNRSSASTLRPSRRSNLSCRWLETDANVPAQYDLGHGRCKLEGTWLKTNKVLASQRLGIVFIERWGKMLRSGRRSGIIRAEGYLSTAAHCCSRR